MHRVATILLMCAFVVPLSAQNSRKIDFAHDIQPLFRANCYGCHGPSKQINGFRLDRRRRVMANRVGANGDFIVPGNSQESMLYLKLVGNKSGLQMPPTEPLNPEQINTIKTWIDQGADWPDNLADDMPTSRPDPKAARAMEMLRNGDRSFKTFLAENPKIVNLKGPGGSTPLMYAALYGDSESVLLLLNGGADPNLRNEAGATALMWSLDDLEKTRLLLDHGADTYAQSDDGVNALTIAAGRFGSSAVVKLLIDRGANASAKPSDYLNRPLIEAARAGDEAVLSILAARGADLKGAAPRALVGAVGSGCSVCVEMFLNSAPPEALNRAMSRAVMKSDAAAIKLLLDRRADVNWILPGFGVTTLAAAAASETPDVALVKAFMEHGGNINAKSENAQTVLALAKQQGDTPVVDLLKKAGAKDEAPPAQPHPAPKPAASIRAAVARSMPLLQRTDVTFIQRSGCVSCHNNNLTAMTVATVRRNGLPLNEAIARQQLQTIGAYIGSWRDRALQDIGIPGAQDTMSYILFGLAVEKYPPDAATDAFAHYLKSGQSADGRWALSTPRPPLESSDFAITAVSMRAIQAYAPKPQQAEYNGSIRLAAAWLAKSEPRTTEDRVFQLLGLSWSGANKETIRTAADRLIALQGPDGGWSQIPSLGPDAYATGQALVALKESGALSVSDAVYKRGVSRLLNTQLEDGSWYVKSRALPLQPYFENDFPHGHDQWISAAATNWATTALALSVEPK
jgi:ankyrin repeat protein